MSGVWKVLVVAVGALAAVAIVLSAYALLALDARLDDRVGELRGPRGEEGPPGPAGSAVTSCEINSNDWDSFLLDIEAAIDEALDGGAAAVVTLGTPAVTCE